MNYATSPNLTPSCLQHSQHHQSSPDITIRFWSSWYEVMARLFHYFEFMAIGVSTEMTTQNPLLLYPENPDA